MIWPYGDPDAVAKTILAQPAYRTAPAAASVAPSKSLLAIAWEWIFDHILRPLFHPVAQALAASQGAGSIVGVVIIALALCALGYVVFRLVVAFVRPPVRGERSSNNARALEGARSAADWRRIAFEAASAEDYTQAIAALFAAALAALDEHAIVTFAGSRTPGEYRRLLRRAQPEAVVPFDELSEGFVRAAYAEARPVRADFEAAARALAAFEPALAA